MMLTLALGQMVWALSLQWIDLFKGMDGIVAIPTPRSQGFDLREPRSMYVRRRSSRSHASGPRTSLSRLGSGSCFRASATMPLACERSATRSGAPDW
jgi:hypothetical protein